MSQVPVRFVSDEDGDLFMVSLADECEVTDWTVWLVRAETRDADRVDPEKFSSPYSELTGRLAWFAGNAPGDWFRIHPGEGHPFSAWACRRRSREAPPDAMDLPATTETDAHGHRYLRALVAPEDARRWRVVKLTPQGTKVILNAQAPTEPESAEQDGDVRWPLGHRDGSNYLIDPVTLAPVLLD